jgi:hypothetical protein
LGVVFFRELVGAFLLCEDEHNLDVAPTQRTCHVHIGYELAPKHFTLEPSNVREGQIRTAFHLPLRPIIIFANVDVSRHIIVVDTCVLSKNNMGQREY